MKILDTKVGRILCTDWAEILVNKISLNMYEKQMQKQRKIKEKLVEYKRKNGLTEE